MLLELGLLRFPTELKQAFTHTRTHTRTLTRQLPPAAAAELLARSPLLFQRQINLLFPFFSFLSFFGVSFSRFFLTILSVSSRHTSSHLISSHLVSSRLISSHSRPLVLVVAPDDPLF